MSLRLDLRLDLDLDEEPMTLEDIIDRVGADDPGVVLVCSCGAKRYLPADEEARQSRDRTPPEESFATIHEACR
jgi:hypothetical protein